MIIWRASKYTTLSGRGGLAVSGRWHNKPKPILYCSDEPHTAYCEILRQVGHPSLLPDAYKMMRIDVPAFIKVEAVAVSGLDASWSSNIGWQTCRIIGDDWLQACRTAVLKVPSAARLGSFNYLINPVHRDADAIDLLDVIDMPFPAYVTEPNP